MNETPRILATRASQSVKMFICYSHQDKTWMSRLAVFLNGFMYDDRLTNVAGLQYVNAWHDKELTVGNRWDGEIKQELEEMDIFVMPSKSEALSNALMEAMASGCAIVASDVGGNPELITSGETGLLIPPKDDAALYAALKEVEQNSNEAQGRVAAAQKRAEQFSIQITIEKLVALLKSI